MTTPEYCDEINVRLERLKTLLHKAPATVDIQPSPENIHLSATVLDAKGIDKVFNTLPWCHFIHMRGRFMIGRKAWGSLKQDDKDTFVWT
jgi:hypothetical protein